MYDLTNKIKNYFLLFYLTFSAQPAPNCVCDCITNLSQDSLVKSACKTLQLFQNEVIVHFLFSFIIEILTSTRKDF